MAVRVYNRLDCCQYRLSYTIVSLLDESDNVIGTYEIENANGSNDIWAYISDFAFPTSEPEGEPAGGF